MPNVPPPNLRPGLTQLSFRRYEQFIRAAVLGFPTPVTIQYAPSGLAKSTFLSQLRDALTSFRSYEWPAAWYVHSEHRPILDQLVSRVDPNDGQLIFLGVPRKDIKSFDHIPFGSTQPTEPGIKLPASIDHGTAAQTVVCYAFMASAGLVDLPKLTVERRDGELGEAMETLLNGLVDQYDIGIQRSAVGGWTIF